MVSVRHDGANSGKKSEHRTRNILYYTSGKSQVRVIYIITKGGETQVKCQIEDGIP